MDDDVHVDVDGVLRLIDDFRRHKNVVLCRVFEHGSVVRNAASKWHLSPDEYAHSTLGTYCQGMAYAFSADLLSAMYRKLKRVQYLWMDDWYVTNGLLNGSKALYIDINKHFLSTNTEDELDVMLNNDSQAASKRVLFAHFRPAEK
ncbi:Protein F48F7.3 [Aphelenchoides avenae]|nr:Protein F48F7.3 [Aphelenchus avenae]